MGRKRPRSSSLPNIKYEESSQTPSLTSQEEDLSLGLLNINGLRNKTHEIRHIIARDKLHVVALCETKLNSSVKHSDIYIPGFSIWRKDRNSYGGGVALYVQDHIETRLRPDLMNLDPTSFTPVMAEADDTEADDTEAEADGPKPGKKDTEADDDDPEVEIIWVEMDLPDRPILLGCCYRPKKDKTKYLTHIKETISQISEEKEQKDIFLMGDFNIDWMSDSEKKEADDLISEEGWEQIVKVPTRVTIDSKTCIDHIYTNILNSLKPKSIPTGRSDHNLITVKIDRKIHQSEGNFRSKQFERGKFNDDIKRGKWGEVCKLTRPKGSLQKALNMFTEIFLQVENEHTKLNTKNIYMLLKLVGLEDILCKRDTKKKEVINMIFGFIETKNEAQVEIEKYLKKEKGKGEKGPASKGGRKKSRKGNITSEGAAAKEEIHRSDPKKVQQQKKTSKESIFKGTHCFKLVTVKSCLKYVCDHVIKIIDETEAELWELSADFISAPIRDILNGYIKTGKFPDELKEIKSFPFSIDSYINIRQSSGPERVRIILSYIFDVNLYVQAKPYFIGNALNSAETLKEKLEQLETDRVKLVEANRAVEAVLLDFTSYFDKISHDLLITKLEGSGFSGSDLELIKSFLSSQEGSSGLPGRSCLAQLLRIIIINNLKKNLTKKLTEPSAVICNSYMMIYGNKTEIMKDVNEWATQFDTEMRRKLFEPSELSAMFKILESMVRCNGDESSWLRAPGNIVKQNGDWEYDNISKELELHFGPDSLH